MVKPEVVLAETLEKAQEVVRVVEEVEEVLTKKSWSCWAFGWNIVATKSPAVPAVPAVPTVSKTESKE